MANRVVDQPRPASPQHLLPDRLPYVPGAELAALYLPGAAGVDVGGDWYDVIALDGDRLMIVVDDVSGRGLRAATVMATLRYSIRAFSTEGHPPDAILRKLANVLDLNRDGHFATILCAVIDVTKRLITIANAGHPNPLLVRSDAAASSRQRSGRPLASCRMSSTKRSQFPLSGVDIASVH